VPSPTLRIASAQQQQAAAALDEIPIESLAWPAASQIQQLCSPVRIFHEIPRTTQPQLVTHLALKRLLTLPGRARTPLLLQIAPRRAVSPEMPDFERVDPLASRAAGWKAAALAMHAASST